MNKKIEEWFRCPIVDNWDLTGEDSNQRKIIPSKEADVDNKLITQKLLSRVWYKMG